MRMATLGRTIAALVLILGIAGCFQARVELTIGPDQRIDGMLLLAYERAMLEQLDRTAVDGQDEILNDLADDGPPGQECLPWEDEEFIGAECRLRDVELDELSQAEAFDQRLTVIETDDALHLTAVVDLDEVPVNDPALLETFDVTIAITFPGPVTESNGEVNGTTVTWRAEPGERTQLTAIADTAAAGRPAEFPIWLIGIVALVVVLVAGVILADRGQTPPPWRRRHEARVDGRR